MKKKNGKRNRYILLLILLLTITVGYATVSTVLKMDGTALVKKNVWSVYWDNRAVTPGSVTDDLPTITDSAEAENTVLSWSATLALPGDYYEFTVDAVNAGTMDAMITGINPTVSPALPTNPDYIKFEVTYADGITPAVNHLLPKADTTTNPSTPTREKFKVKVYYDANAATPTSMNSMSADVTYTFNLDITYGQATDVAKSILRLPSGKTKDNLSVGDELCLQDQCFNFIKYDGDDVVMLAKYNLNVGSNTKGTETFLQDSDVFGAKSGMTKYGNVGFSAINYWNSEISYPVDVYDATNYITAPDFSSTCNDTDNCYKTPGYSVAYYVEQYKTKLTNDYHVKVKAARLLKYSEATDSSIGCTSSRCPTNGTEAFITYTSFWIGTAYSDTRMYNIMSNGYMNSSICSAENTFGVRPVIVVEKSNL